LGTHLKFFQVLKFLLLFWFKL